MKVLVDTNILLRVAQPGQISHASATTALIYLSSAGRELCLGNGKRTLYLLSNVECPLLRPTNLREAAEGWLAVAHEDGLVRDAAGEST